MKKFILILPMLLFCIPAHALMLMGSDWGTFQDKTGRNWLKINFGYFQDYNQIEESLKGTGYSFAQERDMQDLMESYYPTEDNWFSIASLMGSDTSGNLMARFGGGGYAGFEGYEMQKEGWHYSGKGTIGEDVAENLGKILKVGE